MTLQSDFIEDRAVAVLKIEDNAVKVRELFEEVALNVVQNVLGED